MPWPLFRAVADHALLVEFGDTIGKAATERVHRLDQALTDAPFPGFVEAIPAFVNLLVDFDPGLTDHATVAAHLRRMIAHAAVPRRSPVAHQVPVCYDAALAPDIDAVAARTGLDREAVIAAHLGGRYDVAMYGFAPGYAYLAGVPDILRLDRKPSPIRAVAAGSVLIAGPQCLVTTLVMPTGWWIIGRSPARILTGDPGRPFLFTVGDRIAFRRITRAEFEAAA